MALPRLFLVVFLGISVAALLCITTAFAAVSPNITFYGTLQDSAGVDLNGSYDMVFRFYDASTGGTLLDTSTHTAGNGNVVTVTQGEFSVVLGSGAGNALDGLDFNTTPIYVGLSIESDTEMTPRELLTSSAYAFNSDTVDGYHANQLLRYNATGSITASDATELFTITQNGAGDIFNVFDGGTEVFSVIDGGNVGIGVPTPNRALTVGGDVRINGALRDSTDDAGTSGQILQTTGAGLQWVATSSLGFTAGTNPFGPDINVTELASEDFGDFTCDGTICTFDTSYLTISDWYATTTDALTEGAANLYYTDARVGSYITGSSTISLLGQLIEESELNIAGSPTDGYVLQANAATGGGFEWVATSSLGITGGGGSSLFTDGGATTYLTQTGDNLAIGTTSANAKLTVAGEINIDDAAAGLSVLGTRVLTADVGADNYLFGELAGDAMSAITTRNVAIGLQAGAQASTTFADNNVYIGSFAGYNNTTADNVLLGVEAGGNNTGYGLAAIGYYAGFNNTGTENVFIGYETGYQNTGIYNVLTGEGAGYSNTGDSNVTSGFYAGSSNAGDDNVLLGARAGQSNAGNNNVLLGKDTGQFNSGTDIVALGEFAGRSNSGSDSVLLGRQAGISNQGDFNALIGATAGTNLVGDYNIGLGVESFFGASNTQSIAIGFSAGRDSDGSENIYIGSDSGRPHVGTETVIIGHDAGRQSGSGGDVDNSVFVGSRAGFGVIEGAANTAIGSDSLNNVVQGRHASNTAIGYLAGSNVADAANGNIFLGYRAGDSTVNGSRNIIIGSNVRVPDINDSDVLNIGNLVFGTGLDGTGTTISSGNIGIGTTTPTQKLTVAGTIQSSDLLGGAVSLTTDANGNIIRDPSDVRLKENIVTISEPLEKVLQLRGVEYDWKDEDRFGEQAEIGFIAQEVDEVLPEVVRKGGDYWSINTRNIIAVVVEAIREVWERVTDNTTRIDNLESAVGNTSSPTYEALEARIAALEAQTGTAATSTSATNDDQEQDSQPTVSVQEAVQTPAATTSSSTTIGTFTGTISSSTVTASSTTSADILTTATSTDTQNQNNTQVEVADTTQSFTATTTDEVSETIANTEASTPNELENATSTPTS